MVVTISIINHIWLSVYSAVFFFPQFVNFLFSKRNSILDEKTTEIYQDMDRPINHYWIASSHNT